MYRDSYVVALMLDGKIQKESDDGTVLIPFGSEYVLRLKNKLRKRAVADIWIDGKIAVKGIVVDANTTVDLERFVADGNLNEGKRFKLARLTDPKVDQPNDSENGRIEVNFYPEKDEPEVEKKIITITDHHYCNAHYHWGHCSGCCTNSWCSICHPTYGWNQITYTSGSGNIKTLSAQPSDNSNITFGGAVGQAFSGSVLRGESVNLTSTFSAGSTELGQAVTSNNVSLQGMAFNSMGESAATVEGSTSLQKFSSVYIDVDRSKPTTIRLLVKGLSKVLDTCDKCGYKRKKDVKFCPNDGNQLVA